MYTAMFEHLSSSYRMELEQNTDSANRAMWNSVEQDKQELVAILNGLNEGKMSIDFNGITEELETEMKYYFEILMVLYNHLNSVIELNKFKGELAKIPEIAVIPRPITKININSRATKIINKQLKSYCCLFSWNLKTPKSKDLITCIRNQYGDYNLDITKPVFTFERFILNIILAYEFFQKGVEDIAREIIVCVGKWLEELDNSNDKFYLEIKDGLKHVLTTTLIYMKPTPILTNLSIQQLMKFVVPISVMDKQSLATVYAIKAAVLMEYSENKNDFNTAITCANVACKLNPTNAYWFYILSLTHTTYRRSVDGTCFSYPLKYEKKAIKKAITLSNNQNVIIKFHEIMLFRDRMFSFLYTNKMDDLQNHRGLKLETLLQMIETFLNLDPDDPLMVIACGKIFMNLPGMLQKLDLGKDLMLNGLELAPNDLVVIKTIVQAIIPCQISLIEFLLKESGDQQTEANGSIPYDLNLAVLKHHNGIDPVPYLLDLFAICELKFKWDILAQVCSYVFLFNRNIDDGIKYFKLLSDAEKNGIITKNIILCHSSIFHEISVELNLALLVHTNIKAAIIEKTLNFESYYLNFLKKLEDSYLHETLDETIENKPVPFETTSESEKTNFQQQPPVSEFNDDENIIEDNDMQLENLNDIQDSNSEKDSSKSKNINE